MNLVSRDKFKAYLRTWLTVIFAFSEIALIIVSRLYHIPAPIIGAGIFTLYLILLIWYIEAYVNRYKIAVAKGKITLVSGKLFRRSRVIRSDAVIYYERRVGPVGRLFGLCSLTLHLTHHSVALYGLNADTVKGIEAQLK